MFNRSSSRIRRHEPGPRREGIRNSLEHSFVIFTSHSWTSAPRSFAEYHLNTIIYIHLHLLPQRRDRLDFFWTLPLFATSALRLFHTVMNLSSLPTSLFFWYPDGEEKKPQFASHFCCVTVQLRLFYKRRTNLPACSATPERCSVSCTLMSEGRFSAGQTVEQPVQVGDEAASHSLSRSLRRRVHLLLI